MTIKKQYKTTKALSKKRLLDSWCATWKKRSLFFDWCTDGDHFYYREKKVSWTTVEEVRKRTIQALVSGNWPQAVLDVRFEEGVREEQIEMEDANEGEQ